MSEMPISAGCPEADQLLGEVLSGEGREDPYSRYARVRELAPVYRSAMDFWVVTRFADCQWVLRDPRFGKREGRMDELDVPPEAAAAVDYLSSRPPSMLAMNPPDHTRIRNLVSKAFTPRTVERLRPHIERLVEDLLPAFGTGGPVDVMEVLAFPLPVTVIGEMLGVPEPDRAAFQPLVRKMTALLEIVVAPEQVVAAAEASREMEAYFTQLMADRRRQPGEDLLSAMLAVEDGGDTLTEAELMATTLLLFGAGFETTTNLIGNGLLALLRHPGELRRLRADRSLMRTAIDELLRFDSPVQLDGRAACEDIDIGGFRIREGEQVITVLGAANRDPARFSDPDELDLGRDEGPPMSFGSGIHYCLGASLARVEGQVVFDRLLERFDTIELVDPEAVSHRHSLTLRGLDALPVVVGG